MRSESRRVFDEGDQAVVDLLPHLVRHHGFQRRARHFHREVHLALVPAVHDRAIACREEARNFLDRLLRGGKADALELASADVVETFQRERQVRAAARLQHRVDLVHDHHACRAQHVA
jgi:hypothetical protein